MYSVLAVTELLTVEDALARVLAHARPLEPEAVGLAESAGRVLAEDARAGVDLPRFESSAMDGFALRSADTPGSLPVVGRIAAGRPSARPLAAGEAMAISTGRAENEITPEGILLFEPDVIKYFRNP